MSTCGGARTDADVASGTDPHRGPDTRQRPGPTARLLDQILDGSGDV